MRDSGRDPNDAPAHFSDARIKYSNQAISILRALAKGEIVISSPVVGLLRGLGLIDQSLRLTEAGKSVLAKYPTN